MIDSFEIDGYKCFNNFKLNNLSQINIISGANNVGKTAFLEAILLSKSYSISKFREQLIPIFKSRDLNIADINIFLQNMRILFAVNQKKVTFQFKDIEELTDEEFQKIKNKYEFYPSFLIMSNQNASTLIPFIPEPKILEKNEKIFINSSKPTNISLTTLYSYVQDLGKQDIFLKYLQLIDSSIIRIEPQIRGLEQSFLRVSLDNPKQSLISSELGEGTNRFIEILCVLLTNTDGMVLIDEIENGIHYTKLYDIWKAIIEIVEKENIQLFVTTHDRESIEALNEASEAMNFKGISSIKLEKDDEGTIFPIILNHSSFSATVDSGMDIR